MDYEIIKCDVSKLQIKRDNTQCGFKDKDRNCLSRVKCSYQLVKIKSKPGLYPVNEVSGNA